MVIIDLIRRFNFRSKIRREQKLRERCIQYADRGDCFEAARIYRFIVKGTFVDYSNGTLEEFVYPNLEGAQHQVESSKK